MKYVWVLETKKLFYSTGIRKIKQETSDKKDKKKEERMQERVKFRFDGPSFICYGKVHVQDKRNKRWRSII